MGARFADIEIGMVWDEDERAFRVSLRFTKGSIDNAFPAKAEVAIDIDALTGLQNNVPGYADALTGMFFASATVRRFYEQALAAAGDVPVHFRVHIDGPARFHEVRWELLRDPSTGNPIATSGTILFSRYLTSPDWRPIPAVRKQRPKALVVVAAPTDLQEYSPRGRELAPILIDEEIDRARQAFAGYRSEVIAGPGQATLNAVVERLDQGAFDILYLVAHGALPQDVPVLYLEHPDGTTDWVDARRLVERIHGLARRPTIVMLSSCQSAGQPGERRSDDGGELVALGPRLASAGVAAVIAMQGNITMRTAGEFATAFFTEFAEDGVVDRAMAVARRTVRERPDWWVPVLFSRLRSGRTYYEAQFTERGEETWADLALMIRTRLVTPVLGPGLAQRILGTRQEMAEGWVKHWQMPIVSHGQSNLAQVAQYLRVGRAPALVSAYLQDYLRSELADRWEKGLDEALSSLPADLVESGEPEQVIVEAGRRFRELDDGDPYRVVAALPAKVFVTTGWTDLLQDALRERDPAKKPMTAAFRWTDRVDWGEPEHLDPPTFDRPLVYHLFGRLENPESLVLTEDDYFEWLTAWIDRKLEIPAVVRAALTNSSLLFLGYQLDDWDFRVVFQAIKSFSGRQRSRYNHIGVQLRPETQVVEPEAAQRYLESYFGDDQVNIFWADTREFLAELRKRTGLPT